MHGFRNGKYRGHRTVMTAGRTIDAYETYGEYTIEVVGVAKDGSPKVRVNGGRATKAFGHSDGVMTLDGERVRTLSEVAADKSWDW